MSRSQPTENLIFAWNTAIGLQAVDGLEPSEYLLDMANRNVEGKKSIVEVEYLVDRYYASNPQSGMFNRPEESDKVSIRIVKELIDGDFALSVKKYLAIHRMLFDGIYNHAGRFREYNITKSEWVLNGDTVIYGSASELHVTLKYDLTREKQFNYEGLVTDETVRHLATFISNFWQTHVFGEGNTRTTAVFFIKYLRTLGFEEMGNTFAANSRYFRDALVRANYNNLKRGVYATTEYLELFLRNLILGEENELNNKSLKI
ncbi:MAG: Fic family protein [Lentihominibacter sp.]